MKKTIPLTLPFTFIIYLIAFSLSVSAADIDISSTVYDEKEFQQIRELCRDYPVTITEYTFSDEDVTQAYKQYVMDAGVFSQLITSDIPFSDLLMDTTGFYWNQPYSWIVPLQDGKYAYTVPSSEQEGGFYVNGFSIYDADLELSQGFLDFGEIQKILEEKSVEGLLDEQFCFTTTAIIPVDFFAFSTEKERYLIPYTFRSDLTGLTCGKCYTAKEVKEILDVTLPVQYADEASANTEQLAGGGNNVSAYRKDELTEQAWKTRLTIAEKKPNTVLIQWFVAGAAVLIIAGIAIGIILRKKR